MAAIMAKAVIAEVKLIKTHRFEIIEGAG